MAGSNPAAGYTIIEVTLFLGITGLLLLITIFGTGNVIRTNRFTDSSRSLHNYVQKKYDDLINGVNSRGTQASCNAGTINASGTQAAGTSNCLLMGKLILLKAGASAVTTYDIIGTEPTVPNYNAPDEQLIYDFNPTVVQGVNVENYSIPWGANLYGSKQGTATNAPAVDALALIRSPRSTRVVTYTFKEPGGGYDLRQFVNPTANNQNTSANFCLRTADGIGENSKLVVTGGEGLASIQLSYDVGSEDCNGN